jgi:hypothetical protein
MKIVIQLRGVYGKTIAYPMCDKARSFAKIAGTSTLTTPTLREIDALGYAFENQALTVTEPVTLDQLTNVISRV